MNNEQPTMNSFMQNKPNFRNGKINVSSAITKEYGHLTMNYDNKKQTQTKPIYSELVEPISNVTLQKLVIMS